MITSGTVLESWDIILFGQHKFGQHLLTNVDFPTKWNCWKNRGFMQNQHIVKVNLLTKKVNGCWPKFSKSKLQCLSFLNTYRRSSYLILESFCDFWILVLFSPKNVNLSSFWWFFKNAENTTKIQKNTKGLQNKIWGLSIRI